MAPKKTGSWDKKKQEDKGREGKFTFYLRPHASHVTRPVAINAMIWLIVWSIKLRAVILSASINWHVSVVFSSIVTKHTSLEKRSHSCIFIGTCLWSLSSVMIGVSKPSCQSFRIFVCLGGLD